MAGKSNSGQLLSEDVHRPNRPSLDASDTSGQFSGESSRSRTGLQPGTYLVQLPKDQIYRVPPPENARRYEYLSRRQPRSTRCRRCFCPFLTVVLALAILAAIAAAILYLIYRPEKPQFSVARVSITGFDLKSASPISPEFDVTIRLSNQNEKLSFFYDKGSATELFHDGVSLADGAFPSFNQPAKNVTKIVTPLKGSQIQLTGSMRDGLTKARKNGTVPFSLRIEAPCKIKVGSVKTWTMTVKVSCEITVEKLTASANVVTEKCDTGLDLG